MPPVDDQAMRRLAFIRQVFLQGIEQSHLPEPLNATCVLSIHDASELFLVLAAEKLGASLPRHVPFMDYWKLLDPAKLPGGVGLPARQRMDRLNELRNGLKHRGVMPSPDAVDQACSDVRSFLEDATPLLFGLPFAGIDMAEVIPQADVRDLMKQATASAAAGNRNEAMGYLTGAFDKLLRPDRGQERQFGTFGPTIRTRLRSHEVQAAFARMSDKADVTGSRPQLAGQLADVIMAAQAMQAGMRIMALGIDYRQFDRFQQLTPRLAYFLGSQEPDIRYPAGYAPSAEEFDYCRQFVVTVALRMAELEVHTAKPSWHN
jgi:hypothetical protein